MNLEQAPDPFSAYLAQQLRSAFSRHGQAQQDFYSQIRNLLQRREQPQSSQIPAQTMPYPSTTWSF